MPIQILLQKELEHVGIFSHISYKQQAITVSSGKYRLTDHIYIIKREILI